MGVDPDQASLDWIGMKVEARYLRNSQLKPTDVYFVPCVSIALIPDDGCRLNPASAFHPASNILDGGQTT